MYRNVLKPSMSALWFIMLTEVDLRILKALPHWPLFVHSWRLWKLLALLKCFRKISFCMAKCSKSYLVGNNFYWNVLINLCNVNGQQIHHAVRLWQRNLSFCLLFLSILYLSMHCFWFSLKGVLLYILSIGVVLQPSFSLRMNVSACMCARVWERHPWTCSRFSFQHAVEFD